MSVIGSTPRAPSVKPTAKRTAIVAPGTANLGCNAARSSETIDFRVTQAGDAESQSEFICREPSDYSARQFRQPLRNLDQEDIANLITVARIDFMEASDVDLYDNDVGGR